MRKCRHGKTVQSSPLETASEYLRFFSKSRSHASFFSCSSISCVRSLMAPSALSSEPSLRHSKANGWRCTYADKSPAKIECKSGITLSGLSRAVVYNVPPSIAPVEGLIVCFPCTNVMAEEATLPGAWSTNADMPLYRGVSRCVSGSFPSFFMNSPQLAMYSSSSPGSAMVPSGARNSRRRTPDSWKPLMFAMMRGRSLWNARCSRMSPSR
mmetsp:Transcript_7710/g.14547  ORF Transcript_7710/g.14547 Transcript_7710/m.14547 type:complete len:211 (+) Transcript_7710:488-1120(+)